MVSIVAQNTKSIIEKRGLKNKAVAEKAGYTENQFSNLLNDRRVVTWVDVLNISRALNVTPNDLFGFTSPQKEE